LGREKSDWDRIHFLLRLECGKDHPNEWEDHDERDNEKEDEYRYIVAFQMV